MVLAVDAAQSSYLIRFQPNHPFSNGGVFHCLKREGITTDSHARTLTDETRIALFLMCEFVSALRANESDTFRRWLSGGIQDLGEPVVEELLVHWPQIFQQED